MRAYLEDEGFLVRSCADAARVPALFFCGSGAGHSAGHGSDRTADIDLLLIDVDALGATGLRLATELTSFKPDLPVIVISVPEAGMSAWAAMARRGWRFLSKPVLLPEILGVIHCALDPRTRARSPKLPPPAPRPAEERPRSGLDAGSGEPEHLCNLPLGLLETRGTMQ